MSGGIKTRTKVSSILKMVTGFAERSPCARHCAWYFGYTGVLCCLCSESHRTFKNVQERSMLKQGKRQEDSVILLSPLRTF